ncbi:MAG: LLM class flavin-dependent oxidoreductase, partial [Chitinophagaceae bacterium]
MIEFGLMTFADMAPDAPGQPGLNAHQRMQDLLEEIRLADQLELDVFGIGEHHRADYAVSSPAVVLGAAAVITKKVKLTSAVTVLSSDDPVRVFQDFSTIDLLSDGRAEIMAGRGSFIESFPLFGYSLDDYESLFTEKLELLLAVNEKEVVTWSGEHRASLKGLGVYPRPLQPKIPVWIAAGGTPASAVRAAKLGLPLILAIIGGQPSHFVTFINLYKETWIKSGRDASQIRFAINNHFFAGTDSNRAADDFYPHYAAMMNRVGKSRGWPPLSRQHFDLARSPGGALMVGSVQQ